MSQQNPAGEPRSKKSKAEGEDADMIQASSEEGEQFGEFDDGNPMKQQFAMMKAMLAKQNSQNKEFHGLGRMSNGSTSVVKTMRLILQLCSSRSVRFSRRAHPVMRDQVPRMLG
eukprot:5235992-Pyramimonas_sp.AAC.1